MEDKPVHTQKNTVSKPDCHTYEETHLFARDLLW